jgi:hypothetical protein
VSRQRPANSSKRHLPGTASSSVEQISLIVCETCCEHAQQRGECTYSASPNRSSKYAVSLIVSGVLVLVCVPKVQG